LYGNIYRHAGFARSPATFVVVAQKNDASSSHGISRRKVFVLIPIDKMPIFVRQGMNRRMSGASFVKTIMQFIRFFIQTKSAIACSAQIAVATAPTPMIGFVRLTVFRSDQMDVNHHRRYFGPKQPFNQTLNVTFCD